MEISPKEKQVVVVDFLVPGWIFVAHKSGPEASKGIRIEATRDESFDYAQAVLALLDEHMEAPDTISVYLAEEDRELVAKHFPNYFSNTVASP